MLKASENAKKLLRSAFSRKKKRFLGLIVSPLLLFLLLDFVFPFKVNPSYSPLVSAADGTVLHAFLNEEDKWRLYTELEEITPMLRQTILQKEDKYFYYHFGINPVSLDAGGATSGTS
jgi:penicillin-binding protein 1C